MNHPKSMFQLSGVHCSSIRMKLWQSSAFQDVESRKLCQHCVIGVLQRFYNVFRICLWGCGRYGGKSLQLPVFAPVRFPSGTVVRPFCTLNLKHTSSPVSGFSKTRACQEARTQRVPHTLPLWNQVPKTKIGMVFWGPNSIGSVYGPSGEVLYDPRCKDACNTDPIS